MINFFFLFFFFSNPNLINFFLNFYQIHHDSTLNTPIGVLSTKPQQIKGLCDLSTKTLGSEQTNLHRKTLAITPITLGIQKTLDSIQKKYIPLFFSFFSFLFFLFFSLFLFLLQTRMALLFGRQNELFLSPSPF